MDIPDPRADYALNAFSRRFDLFEAGAHLIAFTEVIS